MKLALQNFMILQLWNETEEGLLLNEFGSIMHKFLQLQLLLPEGKTTLILYSDGSAYQNSCASINKALLHF